MRLVLVSTFTPELSGWISAVPLGEALEFPEGLHPGQPPLHINRTLGVVGVLTGMGPFRAAASIMALGHDARFDTRDAHWLVAGIAGVDPAAGSIGSVFFPTFLIGLGQESYLDGVGHIAHGRTDTDTSPPYPERQLAVDRGHLLQLDHGLVSWAFELASTMVTLRDTDALRASRAGYVEAAARQPPRLRLGASVTGETFWAGRTSTDWARNWTVFWSDGEARLGVTDEEDLALAAAIGALGRVGRANATRLLVLRAASDYSYEPLGGDLRTWYMCMCMCMCMYMWRVVCGMWYLACGVR